MTEHPHLPENVQVEFKHDARKLESAVRAFLDQYQDSVSLGTTARTVIGDEVIFIRFLFDAPVPSHEIRSRDVCSEQAQAVVAEIKTKHQRLTARLVGHVHIARMLPEVLQEIHHMLGILFDKHCLLNAALDPHDYQYLRQQVHDDITSVVLLLSKHIPADHDRIPWNSDRAMPAELPLATRAHHIITQCNETGIIRGSDVVSVFNDITHFAQSTDALRNDERLAEICARIERITAENNIRSTAILLRATHEEIVSDIRDTLNDFLGLIRRTPGLRLREVHEKENAQPPASLPPPHEHVDEQRDE